MKLRFDRGTIVLTDPPTELDLAEAPGVLWDPRVRVHRAPGNSYPALKRWLLGRDTRFQDLASPPRPVEEAWSDVDLRPYQEAALSAWELGHRRGVVALPTGSGKTRLALAAMRRTRLAALCLVPTRVLLDQWLREIGGVYRGSVGCYGDGVRQLAPLTVATFENAYRHMDQIGDLHPNGRRHRPQKSARPRRLGIPGLSAYPDEDGHPGRRTQPRPVSGRSSTVVPRAA